MSGNFADDMGGGLRNDDTGSVMTVTNVTLNDNGATNFGGNFAGRESNQIAFRNTLVANPRSSGNCYNMPSDLGNNDPESNGNNLEDGSGSCNFTQPTDINGEPPLLEPLADNGGPTNTHALRTGSPAIDTGRNLSSEFTADQRGVERPQGYGWDIGAFELKDEAPSAPDVRSYVAIGDSLTVGHGAENCGEEEFSEDYPYYCAVEPPPFPAYPDLLQEMLGPPYSEDYTVAGPGDYRTKPLPSTPPYYNRVGVFGVTLSEVLEQYDEAEERGDDRRSGKDGSPSPWESQLHAAEDAQDLLTVHLGIDDLEFYDISYISTYVLVGGTAVEEKVENELEGIPDDPDTEANEQEPGLRPSLDTLFAEHLTTHQDRSTEVVIVGYPIPPPDDKPACGASYDISKRIINPVNKELNDRADVHSMPFVDLKELMARDGVDHSIGAEESWFQGSSCNLTVAFGNIFLPEWIDGNPLGSYGGYEALDPHLNEAGSREVAGEIKRVVEGNR